jgi:chromosome segregation ATPase
MTELQQILQKLSQIESNLASVESNLAKVESNLKAEISKLDSKIDLGFANVETKLANIETELAKIEGAVNTKSTATEGKVDVLIERTKFIEASAGKITDLSEKVGEGRGWRQLIQPFFTTLVTLLIGGGINWILGVYRVVK